MAQPAFIPVPAPPLNAPFYQDLDLLRRDGFVSAREATVALRITDKAGMVPLDLHGSDFALTVNGTARAGRLRSPGVKPSTVPPMVLIVLPPNQPMVHGIALKQFIAYFSNLPDELLPWKVGVFDSNGRLSPYTNGRSQLLANLEEISHAAEPLQRTSTPGPSRSMHWPGPWFDKSQDVIADLQRFSGPKVLVIVNSLAESSWGELEFSLAYDPPAAFVDIAQHIGAHIYVANAGGPETSLGEGALGGNYALAAPGISFPSGGSAYDTSQVMQAAVKTSGGFSNSFKDLAGYIHRDLDGNYSIDFNLTAEDRDRGIPQVQVKTKRRDLKTMMLEVVPIGFVIDNDREIASHEVISMLRKASSPVPLSADFRISQHVDFFPLRGGLEPVVPMTCVVEWKGAGEGPRQISVAESLEDQTLSSVILEREIHARWDRRSLSWERDGRLRPGEYLWRVAVHDGSGTVYASAQERVKISVPQRASIMVSSLILGKSCRDERERVDGLRKRPASSSSAQTLAEPIHLEIDPMRAGDCRVRPEATDKFNTSDTLHLFLRLYSSGKLARNKPEAWAAKFVLHSASGSIEATVETPFTIDSGSGYVASMEMPLSLLSITLGAHTIEAEVTGPGIGQPIRQSRPLWLGSGTAP